MSSFIGQKFYDRAYKDAHPELHMQHRGKGRWYIVANQESTVPPPQQHLANLKAARKAATLAATKDGKSKAPKEPKATGKRPATTATGHDPANPTELPETRPRSGSASDTAIGGDGGPPKTPHNTRGAGKRMRPSPPDAIDIKQGPQQKKTKKTRAPPKPKEPQTVQEMLGYTYKKPQGLTDHPSLQGELKSDLDAMGIPTEDNDERGPEPEVDSMTQRPGTLKREADELEARRTEFDKKQAKRAARKNATRKFSTQLAVDDDGRTSNWVLFKPRHGFPPDFGVPPELFVRLQYYKPGNKKIIVYNTESTSIGLRKVPKAFEGCKVDYGGPGPKLVKIRADSLLDESDNEGGTETETEMDIV